MQRIEAEREKTKEPMRLEDRVKALVVRVLRMDRAPESIEDDTPMFDGGLGLDSIDALELCVHLEKEFGAVVPGDKAREVLRDVRSIAAFVVASGWVEK